MAIAALSDLQKRSLAFGCLDIHQQLADIEALLVQSEQSSPFSRHVPDLSPVEQRVVRDHFARIRATMLDLLKTSEIRLKVDRISLRWTALTGLLHIQVAIAEMRPPQLRGYGELTPEGRAAANDIVQTLSRVVEQVIKYLQQQTGSNLARRLEHLQQSVPDLEKSLRLMDEIINRQGLIECRPQLDLILERLDSPQLEIAVFGRVSSGKSSLLNAVAGQDVLPVGATPITAVPTRLTWGEEPTAIVAFADAAPRRIPIIELADFATEEGNPHNQRHVSRIEVRAPSPRLLEGMVFVDMPGMGSLARHGAQETLAYLPRCDLAVLLVDASSTLNAEDIDLLRLLLEGGIPVQVLISKADLLDQADRQRMLEYIHTQIHDLLQTDLPIFPVSVRAEHEHLLREWFEREIEPLSMRHRHLVELSLRRKAGVLRETMMESLSARLRANPLPAEIQDSLRGLLRRGDRIIREAETWGFCQPDRQEEMEQQVFQRVAETILNENSLDLSRQNLVRDAVLGISEEAGQSVRQSVIDVRNQLENIWNELRDLMPQLQQDDSSLVAATMAALPVLQWNSPANSVLPPIPWWSAISPFWARRKIQQRLRVQWGPAIHETLFQQTRQLQHWMRDEVLRLKTAYDAQVDVARERLLLDEDNALVRRPVDKAALEQDLALLRQQDSESPVNDFTEQAEITAPFAGQTFSTVTTSVT